jgi:hypothetical protein
MKYIKTFEGLFTKKIKDTINIDEDIIQDLIKNEQNSDVKQILLIISKKLNHDYVTLSYDEKIINDDSLESLKSLGFSVKTYDDSNEYSEDFENKVKISWKYIGKNIIDISEG